MLSLFLAIFCGTMVSAPSAVQDYAQAYRVAQQEHKPLLVIVGAQWCPACVNLKTTTLASLDKKGDLQTVSVAVVDQDTQPQLAAKLKRGRQIPQVIMFAQSPDGNWKRIQLNGFQSEGVLKSVISSARTTSLGATADTSL